MTTKVAVFGARGRMGQEICRAVEEAGLELVAAIDAGDDRSVAEQAEVVVDFTHPDVVMDNIDWCLQHGLNVVVGTTGMSDERVQQVRDWLAERPEQGVVVAANYSIGAILMMHFSAIAARFYPSVEIVELHHPNKADAPSGTAATTARKISAARAEAGLGEVPDATTIDPDGARGAQVDGIHVHSVRLPGLFAHQEVVFGGPGEMLTIRDDGFQRSSYMPGVLRAVEHVAQTPGLTLGIEGLLGLE